MSFERVLVDRRYCSCIEVDHRYNPWWSGTWFFVTKDPISTCEEIKRFSFMTKSKSDRALLSFDISLRRTIASHLKHRHQDQKSRIKLEVEVLVSSY